MVAVEVVCPHCQHIYSLETPATSYCWICNREGLMVRNVLADIEQYERGVKG